MRKTILLAVLVAAVAVPAALAAASPKAPGAYCKAHPELIGTGKVYATFAGCVKKQTAQANQNKVNAAKECTTEQADANFAASHGGKTFDQFYGSNGKNGAVGSNAFGKCVSLKATAKTGEQQSAQLNAAKKCRTDALKALTGAGKKYRNFGACVSDQTKAATS